jgi:hypothetical protein
MMKPNRKWIDAWRVGVKPSREDQIATDLLDFFLEFWVVEKLDKKSKTTMNRYFTSLHALGGYLVEQAISDDDSEKTAYELLSEYISPDEGPLVYHENEDWQDEFDMVCRKIYKHMEMNR